MIIIIFNSLKFLIFFPLVVTVYFLFPHRYRHVLLLVASYYFYMVWKPEYILLILLSTIINYFLALAMDKEKDKQRNKKYLYISLISNLGILFIFKYFNFFAESLNSIFSIFRSNSSLPIISLLLPMGISFYTFQTLSYTIDVYRGTTKAEKNFSIFALYVTFFPQLVAGPIERSEKLLPQFYQEHKFDYYNVTNGLKRMVWGFFKKVVIADRVAIMVNTVFNNPTNYQGFPLILATILFAVQIYCDFSGYSDIAIGCAKVMGFDLIENFNRPYFSKSISEFWKRWHISLSRWFRDYLYIPLGGNRVKLSRYYFNLFFTFFISGLWHGASWTFVIWGALHGIYLIMGQVMRPIREKIVSSIKLDKLPLLHRFIQVFITFALVCFAWIFFRANSINDAIYVVKNLFVNIEQCFNIRYVVSSIFALGLNSIETAIAFSSIGVLILVSLIQRNDSVRYKIQKLPNIVRYAVYCTSIVILITFAYVGNSQFIYFQF